MASDLESYLTIYRLVENVGIGVIAGLVWFQKGLGESIGLLFFTTTLFTVPPIFQVFAVAPSVVEGVTLESLGGLYPSYIDTVSTTISSFFARLVWVLVWQIVAFTLAGMGGNPRAMFTMQLALVLNAFCMRGIGFILAVLIPHVATTTVIVNLFAQFCMLTQGFYTKLLHWMQWVTVMSIPRFAFHVFLRTEYSWRNTLEVSAMHGFAAFGFPTLHRS